VRLRRTQGIDTLAAVAITLGSVLIALAVRPLGHAEAYLALLCGLLLSTLLAGPVVGVASLLAVTLVAALFLVPIAGHNPLTHASERIRLGLFALVAALTCVAAEAQRRARSSAIALARLRADLLTREQAARREAEFRRRQLEGAVDQAPALVLFLVGPEHQIAYANRRAREIAAGRELTGHPLFAALPELHGQAIAGLFERACRSGEPQYARALPVSIEREGRRDELCLTITVQPVGAPTGEQTGLLALAIDVTEETRARERIEALAAENARLLAEAQVALADRDRALADLATAVGHLRQVIDALPEAVAIVDRQGTFVLANDIARAILGRDPTGSALPRETEENPFDLRDPEGRPLPNDATPLARSLLYGEEVRGAQLTLRTSGTQRRVPILLNSTPLRDRAGEIVGALAVFQDVERLQRLERARDDFMAAVTHDLRSPLTTIRGMAQLLKRRLTRLPSVSSELIEGIERIERASARMQSLIEELLDLALLRQGRALALDPRPTDLVALAREAASAGTMPGGAPRVRVHAENEPVIGVWDPVRLARVIDNLVANALKYSPPTAPVDIAIAPEGDEQVVLRVRDEGVGIPAADLPHIFERFYRGSNVGAYTPGTGIGLAGARQIVEQHGGTIAVESVEGQGTTVTVRLPLAAPGTRAQVET
jgi:PAS domain S-box-containing protein